MTSHITRRTVLTIGSIAIACLVSVAACGAASQKKAKPLNELQRNFVNLRFGMFIHFNIGTFTNEQWASPNLDPKTFAPSALDCAQWADAAKSAHMTYGALTVKHHDGFCLWPSKFTKYTVAQGCKRDIVKEYAKAFRSRGLKVGLYYSIRDFTAHIGYGEVTPQKIQFIKNQLTELLTKYGEITFIIFDGWNNGWAQSPSFGEIPYAEIYHHIKSLQPNCLVITHQQDPEVTDVVHYEQNAGQKISSDSNLPAQSGPCLQSQWFWEKSFPTEELKSVDFVVNQCLIPFNRINCNLILNCAPNREGRLDDNVVKRLGEIGKSWTPPAPESRIPESWKNWPVLTQ